MEIADALPWFQNQSDALSSIGRFDTGSTQKAEPDFQSPTDLAQCAKQFGFEAESCLTKDLSDNPNVSWVLIRKENRFLVIKQLSLGGLAILLDQDGGQQPANISEILENPQLEIWKLYKATSLESEKTDTSSKQPTLSLNLSSRPLWFWFLPARSVILPIVLATITINILALAIPLATMNIFDRVISNAAFSTLWALAAGVALASGFDFLLRNLRSVVIDQSSAGSDIKLTQSVFDRILGARANARLMPVGVQANALRELEGIREYFSSLTITVLGDLPFVALFLFVIFMVAGQLVIVPLLALPLIFLVVLAGQLRLKKQAESAFQDSAHKNSVAVDVASGIETIKLIGAENWAAKRWEQASGSQLRHSLALRFWTATSVHLVTFLQGITTAALLVYGVYLVTDGELTPGALFAANLLTSRCLGPIASLATILTRLHQMKMALSSVSQLVNMEQEKEAFANKLSPKPLQEALAFEDVSFAYDAESPPVLKGVSLKVEPGERVGIIGAIGSGKSTLLKLLVDLYQPTNGQILWNGIPTHHYDGALLRQHIGSVFQNPTFFRGSIRENIMLGKPDATESDLLHALKFSGALSWLKTQPLGLDTQIGELGAGLSNGQRQTLAVARAFLCNPDFYLFDEPTSDLDSNTERAFVNRLKQLAPEKTMIVVTHRPLLLEAVNRLVVVEKGQVILDGPKAQVLQQLRDVVNDQKVKKA